MGIFSSGDDGKNTKRPAHWLDGWLVQLPVNAQGYQKGRAVTNHDPSVHYKPWYIIRGKQLWFQCPDNGATTGDSSNPRCELSQGKYWSNGKISFTVKVTDVAEDVVILQCRNPAKSHELIQLRPKRADGYCALWMNEGGDKIGGIDFPIGEDVKVFAEVRRNDKIVVKINDQTFTAPMKYSYTANGFNWKVGTYAGNGKSKTTVKDLKWS